MIFYEEHNQNVSELYCVVVILEAWTMTNDVKSRGKNHKKCPHFVQCRLAYDHYNVILLSFEHFNIK